MPAFNLLIPLSALRQTWPMIPSFSAVLAPFGIWHTNCYSKKWICTIFVHKKFTFIY